MRHLPAIVSGPGCWVLPMADRSASLLAELLLADQRPSVAEFARIRAALPAAPKSGDFGYDRTELAGAMAEALAADPPLALWAVVAAADIGRFRPLSLSDLAQWLVEHAPAVLQWPQPSRDLPRPQPTASPPLTELVERGLCLAAVAAELASKAPAAERESARLAGLLHDARQWLDRSAVGDSRAVPEALSKRLSESSGDHAMKWVALAAEILAGDCAPPELDLTAIRARAKQAAQAWITSLPGTDDWLPRLAARLARLEQLETRFQETLEREKLEAMAELAAGAGHEINNPLAIIAGRAQLFLQDETDPERRREAAVIVAQVKRAHEMIADMRLFARPPRPEPQPLDLAALIDSLLGEFAPQAAERGAALVRSGDPGPLAAELDPAQIHVAVHALVRNALEAVGPGGRIEVGLEGDDRSVTIRVADNGPGIAAEHRRHIFDPFFSARQAGRGVGMGLSKCWRIATTHGGAIDVDSQPDEGAVFTLRLPRRYHPVEARTGEP